MINQEPMEIQVVTETSVPISTEKSSNKTPVSQTCVNQDTEKQKCLKLFLSHMEQTAKSNHDLMQSLLQKLF